MLFLFHSNIKADDFKGGINCFIHNVSPIKKNDRDTKWFDCAIQTQKAVVRGVCFDPNPSVVKRFAQAAQSKSPVKLKNIRLDEKQPGKPLDIIIQKER